jgi:hypothetical protein
MAMAVGSSDLHLAARIKAEAGSKDHYLTRELIGRLRQLAYCSSAPAQQMLQAAEAWYDELPNEDSPPAPASPLVQQGQAPYSKADHSKVISLLSALESRIRHWIAVRGLAGPDGDVHPGLCANILEATEALRTGTVPAARVASGLLKMAGYANDVGLTRDPMMKTFIIDLKVIAEQIGK